MTSATQGPGQRGDDGSCREGSPAGGPGGKHATSLGPRCGKHKQKQKKQQQRVMFVLTGGGRHPRTVL